MKIMIGVVLAGVLWSVTVLMAQDQDGKVQPAAPHPPPPFEIKWLPGWKVEHVAFTWGNSGKPLGGPARWAVNGTCVKGSYPADYAESGRIYFVDARRYIWLMERGQAWPIGGNGDLGQVDGPAEYTQFCGGGVYGGGIPCVVASGYSAYISDGGLRKIFRDTNGRWKTETVSGKGSKRSLAAGETANLADLAGIGQLTGDTKGNMYFVLAGGLVKATPDGKVSVLITNAKVNADFAAVYAKKWPDTPKPRNIALGSGEGCALTVGTDGSIYGGGRTWPSSWKVTPDGTFIPLINYAPKDKMALHKLWGAIDPACYEPHCCMGWGVLSDGNILTMNEIPWSLSRSEFDKNQVSVLLGDGNFALDGTPWKAPASFATLPDGSHVCNAPGAYPSRSCWLRMRKEK